MNERAKPKKGATSAAGKARAAPVPRSSGGRKGSAPAESDSALLRSELAALTAQLAEAKAEIARLQKRQELVVNRIDWVIDSLHNLLEDEA